MNTKMNTNANTNANANPNANQVVVTILLKNNPAVSGGSSTFDVPRNVQTAEPHLTNIRFGRGNIGMINVNASHNSMSSHRVDSQTPLNNSDAGASSSRQPIEQVSSRTVRYNTRGQKPPTRLTAYNHDVRAEGSRDDLAQYEQEDAGQPYQHEETFDIDLPIERNLMDPAIQERCCFPALRTDEALRENQSVAEHPQSYSQDPHWMDFSTTSSGSSYVSSSDDGSSATGGNSTATKSTSTDDDRSYQSMTSYTSKDKDREWRFPGRNNIHEGIIRDYSPMAPAIPIQASQSEGIQSVPTPQVQPQRPTLISNIETMNTALEEMKSEIKEYIDNLLGRILASGNPLIEPQPELDFPAAAAAEEPAFKNQTERDGRFADADSSEDEGDFPPAGPVPFCWKCTVGRAPTTTTGTSKPQWHAAQKRNTGVHFENCYQPVYDNRK